MNTHTISHGHSSCISLIEIPRWNLRLTFYWDWILMGLTEAAMHNGRKYEVWNRRQRPANISIFLHRVERKFRDRNRSFYIIRNLVVFCPGTRWHAGGVCMLNAPEFLEVHLNMEIWHDCCSEEVKRTNKRFVSFCHWPSNSVVVSHLHHTCARYHCVSFLSVETM